MTVADLKLPKTMQDFLSGKSAQDIARAEQILNALQTLKVQITVNGVPAVGTIQISGEAALIVVEL